METVQKINLIFFLIFSVLVEEISLQQIDVHTSDNCVTTIIIAIIGALLGISVIGNVVCLLLVILKKQRVGPTFVPVSGPVKQPTTIDSAGVWV